MLNVKLLDSEAKLPTIAHPNEDVGYDLYANESVRIPPGETRSIKTGIALEFVDVSGGMICSRVSLAKQSVIVLPGVVDGGYRGEIVVLLHNLNRVAYAQIKKGMKVAQLIELSNVSLNVQQVSELTVSQRGAGTFGSTGSGLLGRPE